jgi:hypothetical protein
MMPANVANKLSRTNCREVSDYSFVINDVIYDASEEIAEKNGLSRRFAKNSDKILH